MLVLKKTTARHLFLITLIALLVTLPALFYGVFDAHDVKAHLLWSNGFARQFLQGELYPRWLSDFQGGLGSPSFFFYPPFPYYITSLFYPLFFWDNSGWLALASSASLSLILSGIFTYIWLKEITKEYAALIGAIAYMLLPYHLTVNLYLRFAFAEYWALVWLPFIFYFLLRFLKRERLNLIGIILGYCFLALTHLLTFIIFAFVPVFYSIAVKHRRSKTKLLFILLFSIALGLGLSAIYWLPAMTTQDNISTDFLWEAKGLIYSHNFLFVLEPDDPRISFWNYLEVLTLSMGAIAILSCFFIKHKNRQELGYWCFISFAAILMMIPLSQWVWIGIPFLQKLQFPWRFHSLLNLSISATIALVFSSIKIQSYKYFRKPAIAFLLIVSIGLSVWIAYLMYSIREAGINPRIFLFFALSLLPVGLALFVIKSHGKDRKILWSIAIANLAIVTCLNGIWAIQNKFNFGFVWNDNIHQPERLAEILEFKRDPPEYRPKWFNDEIWWSDIEMTQLAREIDQAKIISGQGKIAIEQWKPRNIILQINAQTDIFVKVGQLYYQGWSAKIIDRDLSVYSDRGLLGIFIPQGQHQVFVKLEAGMEEKLGRLLSAISLLLTGFLFRWLKCVKNIDKKVI